MSSVYNYILSLSLITINLYKIGGTILIILGSVRTGYNIDASSYNLIFCRFRYYITFVCDILGPSFLIIASIDRIFITSRNALIRQQSTHRFAYQYISFIILFWLIFHIHSLFFTNIINFTTDVGFCYFQLGLYLTLISYYSLIIKAILIPLLMILFGLRTLKNVRSLNYVRVIGVRNASIGGIRSTPSNDRELIKIVLVDTLIYILFNTMISILLVYQQIIQNQIQTYAQLYLQGFLMVISVFSAYISFCISFYSNLIISKTFRKEIKNILMGMIRHEIQYFPMRTNRFDPSVPSVSQQQFYESNFLKYYSNTPKDPDHISIIDGLNVLNAGNGDFQNVINLLQNHTNDTDVIRIYSSEIYVGRKPFYIYVNEQLFKDDAYTISKLMPLIRRGTFQINNKPSLYSCSVYRGMHLNSYMKQFFEIGTIFRFPGFVSTSRSKEKAMEFGNTLFIINVDSGCLHARDISDLSWYPQEEEWLFSPYSLFEVVSHDSMAITLTSHDNMQGLGMNTNDSTDDDSLLMESSSSTEEVDHENDVQSSTTTTSPFYDQKLKSNSYSKKKKHKKSCSIQ
ncbi:hypothetical protein I4U23_005320 [Adineta vaga]|nr:hypothetical protein I4U23_005320 [Adineta vaga]